MHAMKLNWLIVIYSGIPISLAGITIKSSISEVQDVGGEGGRLQQNESNGDGFWFAEVRVIGFPLYSTSSEKKQKQ